MSLVKLLEKVVLDAVPHILPSLVAVAPAGFKDTSLLSRTGVFESRGYFVAMAILVLLGWIWMRIHS